MHLPSPLIPERYGKAPYFWLLSLVIFGWKALYTRMEMTEIGLILLSICAFLPIYFLSFNSTGKRLMACVFATLALGLIWAPWNGGGSTFCIFAAAMASRITPERRAYQTLGFAGLLIITCTLLLNLQSFFWIPALLFGTTAGVSAVIGEKMLRSKEDLLRKQEEVEYLATIAERERIARDMHDLLGHSLSVIALKAELARKLMQRAPEQAEQEIRDVEKTARDALAEVRAAITGYRSTGFAHELRQACATLESSGVQCQIQMPANFPALSAATENILALLLREAATNILRHGKATQCHIRLEQQAAQWVLSICNDLPQDAQYQPVRDGNGLRGMRERLESLNGNIDIRCEDQWEIRATLAKDFA